MLRVPILFAALTFAAPAFAAEQPASPPPEIGRTKTRAVCSVLRDLVAPALLGAQRNDARFAAARPELHRYLIQFGDQKPNAARGMALLRLDMVEASMRKEVLAASKALGDPRFSGSADADVRKLHDALERLYAVQLAQADAMWSFIDAERRAEIGRDIEGTSALSAAPARSSPFPGAPAIPPLRLSRLPLAAAYEMDRWTGDVVDATTARENELSQAVTSVAAGCGD